MSSPHIEAKDNEFAKVVLMPGDPLRAEWIANTFLHDVKKINNTRCAYAYTGLTKNNVKISVMASGMGMPSIGIYSYELFSMYNVDAIIRVGTCGSLQKNVKLKDIVVATTASTNSAWSQQYHLQNETLCPSPDIELLTNTYEICKKHHYPAHFGAVLSSDNFYNSDKQTSESWIKLNTLGVEMESYALYCNANQFRKKALGIFTVSDSIVAPGVELTREERQSGLVQMIELAIEVAEKTISK